MSIMKKTETASAKLIQKNIEAILTELTQEAATTRRVLERVPDQSFDWRPHEKSMSLGQLAQHIAQTPGGIADIIVQDSFEPKFNPPVSTNKTEMLNAFDSGIAHARDTLSKLDDEFLTKPWSLMRGHNVIFTVPRSAVIRNIMLNHWYHHRGQLSVYLRLLNVPLPSIYGPSADENPFG
jgi:uncharacterized damage-inducible protein DinB